ncbi:MAG TPA: hypothetical protein VNF73_13765, partial [Candidatus Saccharimonadales bacterium]|nr:hypothetical protein [Candidatus Saccharimonadales bacterium]
WVSGRRTALGPRAIFLILVVSTLLADGGALVPPVWSRALFYLALVFPLTYELAFDASALNRPGADRAGRLIEGLGARAGAITVVAIGVALGTVTPDSQGTGTVGRVLFAVPFTALLLAATMARAAFREEAPPSQRTRRVVAAPAIAAVVLAAAAMTAVVATAAGQPVGPRPTAAPSPTLIPPSTSPVATTTATSFAEFHSHATAALRVMHDGVNAAQASIRAEDVAAVATEGAAAATFGGTELAWLDDHPAAGCFAGPWGDWRDVIVRYRAFGGAISSLAASVNGPTTGSAAPSADPLQAVVAASQEWASAVSVFGSAETMAASACGIGSPSP